MITKEQFQDAANIIGCEVEIIQAVYEVEAAGRGYLPDGRVKILFEGHRFWKQLSKNGFDPFDILNKNPTFSNILYRVWDKKQYKGGAAEWDRMSKAIELTKIVGADDDLALKSASYGAFQIMGENFLACGYLTAQMMIAEYNNGGEAEQLNSFIRFVKYTHLDDELVGKNFAAFAKGYNGTAFRANNYDGKLMKAYLKFVKQK